jgi:hypothetical protein
MGTYNQLNRTLCTNTIFLRKNRYNHVSHHYRRLLADIPGRSSHPPAHLLPCRESYAVYPDHGAFGKRMIQLLILSGLYAYVVAVSSVILDSQRLAACGGNSRFLPPFQPGSLGYVGGENCLWIARCHTFLQKRYIIVRINKQAEVDEKGSVIDHVATLRSVNGVDKKRYCS